MTDLQRNPSVKAAIEFTELVRGQDEKLVEQLMPLVRRQSISLDLGSVTRIDAAGLAALIRLFREAREAGYAFSVDNLSPHVREILALVGLDRVLQPGNTDEAQCVSPQFEESAA